MFQLPKTPHRPVAQDRLPPSLRRKRLCNKHSSRSPPRLRGSKVYRRRAPRPRPAPASFTQDASPATSSNGSPDVTYEMPNPSSPLDRYNPTRKTAYNQLMIDHIPSSPNLLSFSTPDNHNKPKPRRTPIDSRSEGKTTPVPKRTRFAPPVEVDDGVFFSSDPAPSTSLELSGYHQPIAFCPGPAKTPTKNYTKPAHTIPPLSFALDVDVLDLPPPYFRFQADSTADDLSMNPACPTHSTPFARRADGPAFAYYIN